MVTIGIIAASTRPGRFPARWLYQLAQQRDDANFVLVDLGLPLLDESTPPAMHQYEHTHTCILLKADHGQGGPVRRRA